MAYSENNPEIRKLAREANQAHAKIIDLRRTVRAAYDEQLKNARAAGDALRNAKQLLKKRRKGEWKRWVAENFQGSYPTAVRYMRVSREWNDPKVAEALRQGRLSTVREFMRLLQGEPEPQSGPQRKPLFGKPVTDADEPGFLRQEIRKQVAKAIKRLPADQLKELDENFDGLWEKIVSESAAASGDEANNLQLVALFAKALRGPDKIADPDDEKMLAINPGRAYSSEIDRLIDWQDRLQEQIFGLEQEEQEIFIANFQTFWRRWIQELLAENFDERWKRWRREIYDSTSAAMEYDFDEYLVESGRNKTGPRRPPDNIADINWREKRKARRRTQLFKDQGVYRRRGDKANRAYCVYCFDRRGYLLRLNDDGYCSGCGSSPAEDFNPNEQSGESNEETSQPEPTSPVDSGATTAKQAG